MREKNEEAQKLITRSALIGGAVLAAAAMAAPAMAAPAPGAPAMAAPAQGEPAPALEGRPPQSATTLENPAPQAREYEANLTVTLPDGTKEGKSMPSMNAYWEEGSVSGAGFDDQDTLEVNYDGNKVTKTWFNVVGYIQPDYTTSTGTVTENIQGKSFKCEGKWFDKNGKFVADYSFRIAK